jgi:hypothetical protein
MDFPATQRTNHSLYSLSCFNIYTKPDFKTNLQIQKKQSRQNPGAEAKAVLIELNSEKGRLWFLKKIGA